MNTLRTALYLLSALCFTTLAWHAWKRPTTYGDDDRRRAVGRWANTVGAVCMWGYLLLALLH